MNAKIISMCIVALLAVGGIGMLSAQPLASVSGTAVLSRGNVPVEAIGVDEVGYTIYSGTGMGAEVVGVKLSFTADIPSGTMIFVSVRDSGDNELAYDAGNFGPITAATLTTFDLWTSNWYGPADIDWSTYTGGPPTGYWPLIPDIDYLIVTVAENTNYVTP